MKFSTMNRKIKIIAYGAYFIFLCFCFGKFIQLANNSVTYVPVKPDMQRGYVIYADNSIIGFKNEDNGTLEYLKISNREIPVITYKPNIIIGKKAEIQTELKYICRFYPNPLLSDKNMICAKEKVIVKIIPL